MKESIEQKVIIIIVQNNGKQKTLSTVLHIRYALTQYSYTNPPYAAIHINIYDIKY